MKKVLLIFVLSFLMVHCNRNKQQAGSSLLKPYSVNSIDSIVEIVNGKISERLSKDPSGFRQFVLSDSTEKVERLSFDSSLRLIMYLQKCGKYCVSMVRYYFKDDQLIKASFATAEGFSGMGLGDYYFSEEKLLLKTGDNDKLPSPETILQRAKKYLKETIKQ